MSNINEAETSGMLLPILPGDGSLKLDFFHDYTSQSGLKFPADLDPIISALFMLKASAQTSHFNLRRIRLLVQVSNARAL